MSAYEADRGRLAELAAQLSIYEQAQEIAHIGSWRAHIGPESTLELTAEARRIFGFEPSAVVRNVDLFNIVHAEDREKLLEAVMKIRTEGVRTDVEVRIDREGGERLVLIVAGPASDRSADVIATVQDVTAWHDGAAAEADQRLGDERDLRGALKENQLFVEYQPIMSLTSQNIVGAEALVRWAHPERGRLEPDEFITLAEESGLIIPLGEWVLERACQELRHWQDSGVRRDFTMSINVSAAQLWREGFQSALVDTVEKAGIPWTSVTLEVTETILVEGVLEESLRAISERGVHVVIDDFGTKYSALGYLPRLPIDGLKIDSGFVQGIDAGAGRAVVTAIAALGRALDLTVTAEGVETEAELATVREAGCDRVQGYLISPPLAPPDCLAFVLAHRATTLDGE